MRLKQASRPVFNEPIQFLSSQIDPRSVVDPLLGRGVRPLVELFDVVETLLNRLPWKKVQEIPFIVGIAEYAPKN